ncbi:hypothetical protein MHH33_06120 [Paenisporosarcina sp. FSL H8-0542]|uniref:hypothetical protein n=1 Tax=unclassified Paenisporosarcina TaxID=2642018 RepID=UPI00034E5BC3|nr:hypothetical protein [Paenisporosarcina sp. HGH0030]EPD54068.1 hypothetical protein HMPREF1210_00053 [Paenisporosarcina sp. HGH0030]
MEPIHVVLILVVIAFSWKIFTILRHPEISKSNKRMALSVFIISLISFAIALYFAG